MADGGARREASSPRALSCRDPNLPHPQGEGTAGVSREAEAEPGKRILCVNLLPLQGEGRVGVFREAEAEPWERTPGGGPLDLADSELTPGGHGTTISTECAKR
jgi:hypothetical protein